ncbi:LamG-like jellyroll fold domain-containing protein [Streptomyces sp. NPDC051211]|uniref:LamG domain-containing protein n=1 Tax=Streptomyces sp. NPDC051211 TaxID=3154643 RepID=UPI00344B464C
MTDGTDRTSSQQPDPATGNGGYGYPAGQTPGGYGYPQAGQPNPYQQPAPEPQAWAAGLPTEPSGFPQQAAPQPDWQQQPAPFAHPVGDQPDWQALADQNESRRGRKKALVISASVLVVALAAGGGWFAWQAMGDDEGGDTPTTAVSGSPNPSASASGSSDSPTVEGEPNLLRDRSGKVHIALGPDTELAKLENRNEIRLKGNPNSYAQGAGQAVNTAKSFTVSARVYNVTEGGSRMAVSQGDGVSYSFELGFEESNGKKVWVFRVQTGDKGAASTAQQVQADAPTAVKNWAMLTGTYDAEKKTMALYVDDKPAGTAAVAAPIWSGPGPVQLGRSRHHGIWTGSWAGSLDHVRVWDKVLTPEQVADLKNNKLNKKVKPSHSWLIG